MRRHWLLLILLSLAASIAVPLYVGGMEGLRGLLALPGYAVALLLGMVLMEWVLHAIRLPLLADVLGHPLSHRKALSTVIAAEFAGLATPAGTGAGATYLFLLNRAGIPVGVGAGLTMVNVVVDTTFFATFLPAVALIYLLGDHLGQALPIAGALAGLPALGLALLMAVIRYHRRPAIWLGRRMHRFPRQRYRLARLLVQLRGSIRMLVRMGWQRMLALYLLAGVRYVMRYGLLPLVLFFLGGQVPWEYLFIIQGVVLFAGQATFVPGGGGGVEIGMGLLLAPYLEPALISTALLAWRFLTFYWYLLVGGIVFVVTTGHHARNLMTRSAE